MRCSGIASQVRSQALRWIPSPRACGCIGATSQVEVSCTAREARQERTEARSLIGRRQVVHLRPMDALARRAPDEGKLPSTPEQSVGGACLYGYSSPRR